MFHQNVKTCHFKARKYNKTSKTSLKPQNMGLKLSTNISRCLEGPFLAEIEAHIEFDAIFFLLKKISLHMILIDSKLRVYGKTQFKRNLTHNCARNHKRKEFLVRSKVEHTLVFINTYLFSSNLAEFCALHSINYMLNHPLTP